MVWEWVGDGNNAANIQCVRGSSWIDSIIVAADIDSRCGYRFAPLNYPRIPLTRGFSLVALSVYLRCFCVAGTCVCVCVPLGCASVIE